MWLIFYESIVYLTSEKRIDQLKPNFGMIHKTHCPKPSPPSHSRQVEIGQVNSFFGMLSCDEQWNWKETCSESKSWNPFSPFKKKKLKKKDFSWYLTYMENYQCIAATEHCRQIRETKFQACWATKKHLRMIKYRYRDGSCWQSTLDTHRKEMVSWHCNMDTNKTSTC